MKILTLTTGNKLPSYGLQIVLGWFGFQKPWKHSDDYQEGAPIHMETWDLSLLLIHVRLSRVELYGSRR